MPSYPTSLIDFQKRFPDDAVRAAYLFELRWPAGFRCPRCGHHEAWALKTEAWTQKCKSCGHRPLVRASTIM